jgi:hypothetical protein
MPGGIESPLPLESITISLDYVQASTSFGQTLTNSVSAKAVYSRARPSSWKRWCGKATMAETTAMVEPGQFMLSGNCNRCCTCNPGMFIRNADRVPCGTSTWSGTPPLPANKTFLLLATFFIEFTHCRPNQPLTYDLVPSAKPLKPNIAIAIATNGDGAHNAVQTITVTPPAPGAQGWSGTATLHWSAPDETVIPLVIDCSASDLNTALDALLSPGPDLLITRIKNGIQVAFIGQWRRRGVNPITLVDNSLTATAAAPRAEHLHATVSVTFDDGTPAFADSLDIFNTKPCTGQFQGSKLYTSAVGAPVQFSGSFSVASG